MPESIWPKYRTQIAGLWKCISFEMFNTTTGELISRPHGDTPLGLVQISPNAFLSAHIARPDRKGPLPSGNAWQTGEDAEVAHVARGLSMYCGHLQLFEDDQGLYWETQVEIASDPSRFGGVEHRRVQLEEKDGRVFMTLRPRQDLVLEVNYPFC